MKLTVAKLKKSYARTNIFNSWSCSFETRCYAIVGRNGVGKSTLLEILAGVEGYQSGDIMLDGKSLSSHEIWYKQQIGYSPDRLTFYPFLTVRDFFRLVAKIRNTASLNEDSSLIQGFMLTEHFDKTLDSLSLGTKKKVLLVAALLDKPNILLLDEPTDELDKASKEFLVSILIKRVGLITIISTHDEELLNKLTIEIINLD